MTHVVGLRMRNWMRYRGEHELEFGPGCYAVVAEHAEDRQRSNYLGKSALLAALRWALEGKSVEDADVLDDLISRGEDEVQVDLELSSGVFVSRLKHRRRSASLEVVRATPEEGERSLEGAEAQALIEREVGIDAEDRLTTCWSEQKELDRLVRRSTTSSVLTATIEGWLELERLVSAGKRVVDEFGARSEEYAAALAAGAELGVRADPVEIERLGRRVAELTEARERALVESERIRKAREQHVERRLLAERQAELARVEAELAKAAPPPARPGGAPRRAAEVVDQEAREAHARLREAKVERERLLRLVAGEFDGRCPVSAGFECPARADINRRAEPNHEALEAAEAAMAKAQTASDKLHAEVEAERRAGREAVERARAEAQAAERRRGLEQRRDELRAEVERARSAGVTPLAPGEEAPPVAVAPDTHELDQARADLADRQEAARALPEALAAAERTRAAVRVYRLAAGILGPEGARRRVADRAVRYITDQANSKLADAGIDLRVSAAWGREVGVLAEQCPECGKGYPRSQAVKRCERCGATRGPKVRHEFRWRLSNTSGAARDLVGLALRASAFEWLRAARGAAWSVAVLDEVTGQLDRAHRAAMSAGIRRLLVGTFEQAFVTAHEPGVLEACDRRVLITGAGEWSTVRVA